jgi:TatD DNase family protein
MILDTHAHLSLLSKRGIDAHRTLRGLFAPGCAGTPAMAGIIDVSLENGDLAARVAEFSVYPSVRFASGLWPHAASIARRAERVTALEQEIRACGRAANGERLVCALGEFGLDHHWNSADHGNAADAFDTDGERELMEMHLDLARRLSLPVIIHSRDAPQETAAILEPYRDVPGVIHCFSYDRETAKTFLDMGFYISFAGNLTYKNAQIIRDACTSVPADRLLLETDCPFLAPVPFRGAPAHPGMVSEVYALAADIRGEDLHALARRIMNNAQTLFGAGWAAF